jgi:hypothetical protein
MFTHVWRRRWGAALTAVCATGALAIAGVSAGAASAQTLAGTHTLTQARVPWAEVGPGWNLVEYTNATLTKQAPATLYLVSPGGTRYSLYSWRASEAFGPWLIAWSGDKTRALLRGGGTASPAS